MPKLKLSVTVVIVMLLATVAAPAPLSVRDPGVRGGPAGAGGMLPGLTGSQSAFFSAGRASFEQTEALADGLGPRFNLDSCAGCHAQPMTGGTSPAVNPQVAVATALGADNSVPSFVTLNGPVREARFKFKSTGARDGGVHNLFVISGRKDTTADAGGCSIKQEDFEAQLDAGNVIFRIPTPVFGTGLIEQIPDGAIVANQYASAGQKTALGIAGRPHQLLPTGDPNRNGNDGTIARFGWKAQNKSLLLFAGEAYAVEMGITNELFQTERDETPSCQFAPTPNDVTNTDGPAVIDSQPDIQKFAFFMRFLAPPQPSTDTPGGDASIDRGRHLFEASGCYLCHTPTLRTRSATVAALANQPVNLFSDLLLHRMGPGLADNIIQGQAGGDEFRTAPLWGLGKRIFFLHDGRTTDLRDAIQAHYSVGDRTFPPSEANGVIGRFNALTESQQQDVLNFLRSL
jgi:CxxC motif-containing protein (DUF1111 family)